MQVGYLFRFIVSWLAFSSICQAEIIDPSTVRIGHQDIPMGATSYTRDKEGKFQFQISPSYHVDKLAVDFTNSRAVKADLAKFTAEEDSLRPVSDEALEIFHGELEGMIGGIWADPNGKTHEIAECSGYLFRFEMESGKLFILDKTEAEISTLEDVEFAYCYGEHLAVTVRNDGDSKALLFRAGELTGEYPVGSIEGARVKPVKKNGKTYFYLFRADVYGMPGKRPAYLISPQGERVGIPYGEPCYGYMVVKNSVEFGKFSVIDEDFNVILTSSEGIQDVLCGYNGEFFALVLGEVTYTDHVKLNISDKLTSDRGDEGVEHGPTLIGIKNDEVFASFMSAPSRKLHSLSLSPKNSELPYRAQFLRDENLVRHLDFSGSEKSDHNRFIKVNGCKQWYLDHLSEKGFGNLTWFEDNYYKWALTFVELKDLKCSDIDDSIVAIVGGNACFFDESIKVPTDKLLVVFSRFAGKEHGYIFIEKERFLPGSSISHLRDSMWRIVSKKDDKFVASSVYDLKTNRQYSGTIVKREAVPNPSLLDYQALVNSPAEVLKTPNFMQNGEWNKGSFENGGQQAFNLLVHLQGQSDGLGFLNEQQIKKVFALGEVLADVNMTHVFNREMERLYNGRSLAASVPNSRAKNSVGGVFSQMFMRWMRPEKNTRYWFAARFRILKSQFSNKAIIVAHNYAVKETLNKSNVWEHEKTASEYKLLQK